MTRRILIAVALVLAARISGGADQTILTAGPQSRLVMEGSSNVTDWRCSGTSLEAEATVAATIEKINDVIDRIEDGNIGVWMSDPSQGSFPAPSFRLRVPIRTLRCGNSVMERDMNRALKSGQYPTIDFRLVELRSGVQHDIDRNVYRARIAGELVLAGSRREVVLVVTAQRIARDRFRVRAELPLRMTDFGITPPTALFGMVKAGDELVVRFDMMLQVAHDH